MNPTRALIEAIEAYTKGTESSLPFKERLATTREQWRTLQTAISAAQVAEDGVETKWRVEVRSASKYGDNWDTTFDSFDDAKSYTARMDRQDCKCTILAVETTVIEVREKEGL